MSAASSPGLSRQDRNPYAVFQSTEHPHRFMYRASRLQRSDDQPVAERVIRQYQAMYRKNEYSEMVPSIRLRVARAWQRNFHEWGYAA